MDRTSNRFDAETLAPTATMTKASSRREGGKKGPKASRLEAKRDRARRVEFEAFAVVLREELAPEGVLETIYVGRTIVAAWRLREAAEAERAGMLGGFGADSPDLLDLVADFAERDLLRSLEALERVRGLSHYSWGRAARLDTTVPPIAEVAEDAPIPFADIDEPESDDAPLPRWQDRLVFDADVSEDSPVVRGTWVTVSQVVTLIIDGQTWADILRSHPELTEDDIRACLGYATEQEDDETRGIYLP